MAQMPKLKVDFELGGDAQRLIRLAEGAISVVKSDIESDLLRNEAEKRVIAEKFATEVGEEVNQLRQQLDQQVARAEAAEREAREARSPRQPELDEARRLLSDAQAQQRADEVTIRDFSNRCDALLGQIDENKRYIGVLKAEIDRLKAPKTANSDAPPRQTLPPGCICGTGGYPSPCPVHDPGRVGD